jgi:heme-degrading monooxygenase HmoA
MPILVRHRPEGMTPEMYDQVAPQLFDSLRSAPGFIFHVTYSDDRGFCVAEVWESQETHDAWIDEYVRPNVPVEIHQEVIQLHNVVAP